MSVTIRRDDRKRRSFVLVFSDQETHASGLCRVSTRFWYHGGVLLFECTIVRRANVAHDWSNPEEHLTLLDAAGETTAIRRAIVEHNRTVEAAFTDLERVSS